ncbi:MAG: lysylphosphatidylglycerol synthase transmembrane domain-containing protein [Acidimicrobiales bacterium]|nr:YbhN family protein [Actinomycetota bacterium]
MEEPLQQPATSATGSSPADPAKPAAPEPPAPEQPRRGARLRRWWRSPPFRWAVAIVVLFFVLEYVLLPDLANARHSLALLGRVNIVGLLVGAGLEVIALLAYAELSHTVLSPGAPRRTVLFRVNMSSLAVSHVVPGGTAPGTAVGYRLLTELGVPSGTAAFGLATQGIGSAVVLNVIFFLALLISIPLTGYNPLYGFAAIFGVILIGLFAGMVLLLTRGQRAALERLHGWANKVPLLNADKLTTLVQTIADRLQILLRNRALLVHALEWAAANWLFDAASLWVFVLAFGHVVSPIDLLVAYGLANILAVIPITPSGLGVVEGVLIPSLVGFHVPKTVAILGVLSWRLVNFWLPIPGGGIAYLSLRFAREDNARSEASDELPSHDERARHRILRRHTRNS